MERHPQWVASGFLEKVAALELPPAITVVKSQGPHTFQSWALYSGNRSPVSCRDNKQTLRARLGPVCPLPAHEAPYCAYSVQRPALLNTTTAHSLHTRSDSAHEWMFPINSESRSMSHTSPVWLYVCSVLLCFKLRPNNVSRSLWPPYTSHQQKLNPYKQDKRGRSVKTAPHGWGGPESRKKVADRVWNTDSNGRLHWPCNLISHW